MRDPSTHSVHTATIQTSERAGMSQEQAAGESQHRMRATHALGRSPLGETQWQSPSLPALFGTPPQSYATPATSATPTSPSSGDILQPPSDFTAEYAPTVPTLPQPIPPHGPGLSHGLRIRAAPIQCRRPRTPPEPLVWLIATITPGGGTHHMEGAASVCVYPREPPHSVSPTLHPPDFAAGCSWQWRDGRLGACSGAPPHTTSAPLVAPHARDWGLWRPSVRRSRRCPRCARRPNPSWGCI